MWVPKYSNTLRTYRQNHTLIMMQGKVGLVESTTQPPRIRVVMRFPTFFSFHIVAGTHVAGTHKVSCEHPLQSSVYTHDMEPTSESRYCPSIEPCYTRLCLSKYARDCNNLSTRSHPEEVSMGAGNHDHASNHDLILE